jgi:hypothetical protein
MSDSLRAKRREKEGKDEHPNAMRHYMNIRRLLKRKGGVLSDDFIADPL